ncbi:MAG: ATP-binding protein [Beijerinckiaceae bacterium]
MAIKASIFEGRKPGAAARAGSCLLLSTCLSKAANAEDTGLRLSILTRESGAPIVMDMTGPLGLIFVGLVILTTTTAVLHIIGRQRWAKRLAAQSQEIGALQAKVQQADIFMSGERHVVVAWGNASGEPDIEGDVSLILGAGAPRRILGFSQWLNAPDAKRLDEAVEKLKLRGEGFTLAFDGSAGKRLEIDGRAVSGRAVMRVREVSGDRLEKLKAEENYGRLAGEMAALHAVLDAVPQPVWLRYPDGRLAWVNRSFAEAVDCRHPNEVISKGMELIDRPQREKIALVNKDAPYRGQFTAIMAGKRTVVDVSDVTTPFGSGGIAYDASEIELLRIQLEAEMAAHVRTLNELPIAVAIFDRKKQLRFNNAAFVKLWGLDPAFLNSHPGDGEILDRLRAERRIPEQVDFKGWKQALLDGYQKTETDEHVWHLPDGRMLRVVASPTPDGGINYVYDDMTERMTLEAQFKALSRVQNETLDSLKEGVAVFGSDGRLKLANIAFATIWRLHAEALQDSPHIDEVIRRCPLAAESNTWVQLSSAITGLTDARLGLKLRDVRPDNSVVDCATSPLPDGATLVTFADVTANVNAELFLHERNDALETAARMKNEFIRNVSYELRTPLQNVTMATGMLADETVGALTQKQKEYAQAAQKSADALLSLMNDIFDLASLDAGTLALDQDKVSPAHEINAVATALSDRLVKAELVLSQNIAPDTGTFDGDAQRIRQVLYHLLANAIGFSSPGQTITISAHRDEAHIVLSVADQGIGIPDEALGRIFERFESHTKGSNHRGVGLGLSMVKAFVSLHNGELDLKSAPGQGTTVICRFPLVAAPRDDVTSDEQKAA